MSEESDGARRRKRKSDSKYTAVTITRWPAKLFEAMRLAADREDMPVSMLQRNAMKRELRRLGVPIGGQR
jgi:hypothetical protein